MKHSDPQNQIRRAGYNENKYKEDSERRPWLSQGETRVHAREAKRGIGGVTVSRVKRLSVEQEEVGRQGPGAE